MKAKISVIKSMSKKILPFFLLFFFSLEAFVSGVVETHLDFTEGSLMIAERTRAVEESIGVEGGNELAETERAMRQRLALYREPFFRWIKENKISTGSYQDVKGAADFNSLHDPDSGETLSLEQPVSIRFKSCVTQDDSYELSARLAVKTLPSVELFSKWQNSFCQFARATEIRLSDKTPVQNPADLKWAQKQILHESSASYRRRMLFPKLVERCMSELKLHHVSVHQDFQDPSNRQLFTYSTNSYKTWTKFESELPELIALFQKKGVKDLDLRDVPFGDKFNQAKLEGTRLKLSPSTLLLGPHYLAKLMK